MLNRILFSSIAILMFTCPSCAFFRKSRVDDSRGKLIKTPFGEAILGGPRKIEADLKLRNAEGRTIQLNWRTISQGIWNISFDGLGEHFAIRTWIELPETYSLTKFQSNNASRAKDDPPEDFLQDDRQFLAVNSRTPSSQFAVTLVSPEEKNEMTEIPLSLELKVTPPFFDISPSCKPFGIEISPKVGDSQITPYFAARCEEDQGGVSVYVFYPPEVRLWLPSTGEWQKATPGLAVFKLTFDHLIPNRRVRMAEFFLHQNEHAHGYEINWKGKFD